MPAYYQYKCQSCGYTQERYHNVTKCPRCRGMFQRVIPLWQVNIGDKDILKVRAFSLKEVEHAINKGGQFTADMINSVLKIRE